MKEANRDADREANATGETEAERRTFLARAGKIAAAAPAAALLLRAGEVGAQIRVPSGGPSGDSSSLP